MLFQEYYASLNTANNIKV